jgi:4-hydroxy-tetrahydrodipicolinate reductase
VKIGVLGVGKTGGALIGLDPKVETVAFDSKNPPTIEKLKGLDAVIAFVPAEVFMSYLDLLIEARVPVVSGATGELQHEMIHQRLLAAKLTWIWGSNFSLGMSLVKTVLETLGQLEKLNPEFTYSIHEVHHTKKLDAPSGTAKSWASWLKTDIETPITSARIGDVIGLHELTIKSPYEKIFFSHESLDRKLFAKGALFAARFLRHYELETGLHYFDKVVKHYLKETL